VANPSSSIFIWSNIGSHGASVFTSATVSSAQTFTTWYWPAAVAGGSVAPVDAARAPTARSPITNVLSATRVIDCPSPGRFKAGFYHRRVSPPQSRFYWTVRAAAAVASSSGKKHSMRSSWSVMSCGVPNTVTAEK
jgi:hypothetical protein